MERFDLIKDMTNLIVEINQKNIVFGRFNKDGKITENMVKNMMIDITYIIFFNNFEDKVNMDFKSIGDIAALCSSYLIQRVDLWHSLYVVNNYKTNNNLPNKYSEIHNNLYYELGGNQRDFSTMRNLFEIIALNCD